MLLWSFYFTISLIFVLFSFFYHNLCVGTLFLVISGFMKYFGQKEDWNEQSMENGTNARFRYAKSSSLLRPPLTPSTSLSSQCFALLSFDAGPWFSSSLLRPPVAAGELPLVLFPFSARYYSVLWFWHLLMWLFTD